MHNVASVLNRDN